MKTAARFFTIIFLIVFVSEVCAYLPASDPSEGRVTRLLPSDETPSGFQIFFESEQEFEENVQEEGARLFLRVTDLHAFRLIACRLRGDRAAADFRLRINQQLPAPDSYRINRSILI